MLYITCYSFKEMTNLLAEYLRETATPQGDFAAQCGIDQPMVSMYLSGKRRPGLDAAFAIERASGGRVPAAYWASLSPIARATPRRRRVKGRA